MTTMADVFRTYGAEYLTKYKGRIPSQHLKTIKAIRQCRTEALGGQLWFCEDCKEYHYSYHSCQNRHCPNCQNERADEWIEKQNDLLLPATYFLVTFTLPQEFRPLARTHQKIIYNLFFNCSAQALQELAHDSRFLGGQIGMVGILQTWTRSLSYHPHIHFLIPAGAISPDGEKWLRPKGPFLMHYKPLAILFRGKLKAALKKAGFYQRIPTACWNKKWVVDIKPVGNAQTAVKYLAPYIYRVAISNRNILSLENGWVTYRFKDSETANYQTRKVPAHEFMRLFLQHVLPRGFVKVRYFGFLATKKRKALDTIKELLSRFLKPKTKKPKSPKSFKCPICGKTMRLIGEFSRPRAPPSLQFALVDSPVA